MDSEGREAHKQRKKHAIAKSVSPQYSSTLLDPLVSFVRHLKHFAHPHDGLCPLDDYQVSTIASWFLEYRYLYEKDPGHFAKTVYDVLIRDVQKDEVLSYKTELAEKGIVSTLVEMEDVVEVLNQCRSMSDSQLLPMSELVKDEFVSGLLRSPGITSKSFIFVKPAIKGCMFCTRGSGASVPLKCVVTTQGGVSAGPSGMAWAYEMDTGARIAALCVSTCPVCHSTYSLQTYTPGSGLQCRVGASLMPHC
jgi:hypothetical protein